MMDLVLLDFYFPFFVFIYGLIVAFIHSQPHWMALIQKKCPAYLYDNIMAHRILSWICLLVGGLWSLQQMWLN